MEPIFDLVIPVSEKDIDILLTNLFYIQKYIKCDKVIIISSKCVCDRFRAYPVRFMEEDELDEDMSYKVIYDDLVLRGGETRAGWYFQQFLKMAYAQWSKNEYYLIWDADTIPIKEIRFFDDGMRPIFSVKDEYNKAYFDTINVLLGLKKSIKESFIAEHMMFRKDYMLQLIDDISSSSPDQPWFKTILSSVRDEQIRYAGFSEFETYGTYVIDRYPGMYSFRRIKAFRNGRIYFKHTPSTDVLQWIAKKYETISFEKSQKNQMDLDIYRIRWFRKIVPFDLYIFFCRIVKKCIRVMVKENGLTT